MTKKIFLISILLCFSYLGFTQTTPEEKAKKVTSEIAKVLSLNEVQKEEVYTAKIQQEKYRTAKARTAQTKRRRTECCTPCSF